MQSNFDFLQEEFPLLFQIGSTAESYLYTDANSCLYKLGLLGESIVNILLKSNKIAPPEDNTHTNRIRTLKHRDFLPSEVDNILFQLRKSRNAAVHAHADDVESCKRLLELAHKLTIWFLQAYGTQEFPPLNSCCPQDRRGGSPFELRF